MRAVRVTAGVLAMLCGAAAIVRAQSAPVTAADELRLEASADDIGKQVTSLKKTDATLAASVEKSLADLRDEITYLKVKLRKDGNVPRADYVDLRDRLEALGIKAGLGASDRVSVKPVTGDPIERILTVPVGTTLDARLQTPLNSATAKVEQRFEATTMTDVRIGNDIAVPAGTLVRGFVSSVSPAGRIANRTGSVTLSFDEIVFDKHPTRLRASVTQALDGKMSDDATRIGAGAAMGAVIGGLIGGGKGALVGVLVGGGGTIAATDGSDVDVPAGTILKVRVDQPFQVSIVK
jgi:hypothetical protein